MAITATAVRRARHRLVEEHLALVARLARNVRGELDTTVPAEELEAYGHEALVVASRRWDPRRGVPFSSYARHRVRGAILDGIAELGGVPRRLYRRLRFDQAASHLLGGWAVIPGDVTDAREVREALHTAYLLASDGCDDWGKAGDEEELRLGRELLKAKLVAALERLPTRERDLLYALYYQGATLREAGKEVGVSKSHADRLHRTALRRLRSGLGLGRPA